MATYKVKRHKGHKGHKGHNVHKGLKIHGGFKSEMHKKGRRKK